MDDFGPDFTQKHDCEICSFFFFLGLLIVNILQFLFLRIKNSVKNSWIGTWYEVIIPAGVGIFLFLYLVDDVYNFIYYAKSVSDIRKIIVLYSFTAILCLCTHYTVSAYLMVSHGKTYWIPKK